MRTTYTPAQRREAQLLWRERQGKRLTPEQRRQVRAQLNVTASQQLQFQAYEEKLQAHRAETLTQVQALLHPEQKSLLAGSLTDFEGP